MSLKNRLRTLRSQSGAAPAATPALATPEVKSTLPTATELAPPAPGVSERIDRLRPRHQTNNASERREQDLAERLGGEWLEPGVLLIERDVPLADPHGHTPLTRLRGQYQPLPEAEGLDPQSLLFLDTETTGLSGGTGTLVFLLGLGRLEGEHLKVRQYLLTRYDGEPALLDSAAQWAQWSGEAATVVSFNGKAFDVPLLAARCRLAGLQDFAGTLPHVDLLHPTRRAFASRWSDCRLVTAEQRLLGFHREDDLPGSEAPAAWFSFIHAGNAAMLPGVAKHNFLDIVSLAALLPAVAAAHQDPIEHQADTLAIARGHLKRGAEDHALRLLEQGRHTLTHDGLLELARIYRRLEQWQHACPIWETQAAQHNCLESLERLAKYHEHVVRDYRMALEYAGRLPEKLGRERVGRLRGKVGEGLV